MYMIKKITFFLVPLACVFSLSAKNPDIALVIFGMDANGNATAVWEQSTGAYTSIQSSTKPFGRSWQTKPDTLSSPGQNANSPKIAVDPKGNATVVWVQSNGNNTSIQSSTRLFGSSWQRVSDTLSSPGQNALNPQISVDFLGNLTAVWEQFNGTNTVIQSSTKLFGRDWQRIPDRLSSLGQNAKEAKIVLDPNGNATAIWLQSDGTNEIVQASTKPFGRNWQSRVDQLSSRGQNAKDPQISVDSQGNITAIWLRSNAANDVVETITKPIGRNWQINFTTLSLPNEDANFPTLTSDLQGNVTVAWSSTNGRETSIQASSKFFGGNWQASPTRLAQSGAQITAPSAAYDFKGNVTVVWSQSNGSRSIIQAATRPFGRNWQSPVNISPSNQNAETPFIEADFNGNMMVTWTRLDGNQRIFQSSSQRSGTQWQTPDTISTANINQ